MTDNQYLISAGIVTFNPDIERLDANVAAIIGQVDEVVIFDNGSANLPELVAKFGERCTVLDNLQSKNLGIASALNEICSYCQKNGNKWVLTLDQDSVCPGNIIEEYAKYIAPQVGMLTPRINDRNIGDIDSSEDESVNEVDTCITSASLLNIDAWQDVGGFWEELFIDMVDFDICWSLKEKRYRIIRINSVSLLHELGHSTSANFRGNKVAVFNHSPLRYYYIARNTMAVGRKHHRLAQCMRWILKRAVLILRYESDKYLKIRAMICGVTDAVLGRLGPCQRPF